MKVVATDGLAREGIELLQKAPGIEVVARPHLEEAQLRRALRDAEALIVRSATRVTAELLEAAPRLRVIGRAGIGYDNLDVQAATRRGILVMNTPGGSNVTTAELTLSLMLALARKISQATASIKAGRWERARFVGMELQGKTLGLIGLGNVGTAVAERAKALRMEVLAYDPYISEERAAKLGVERVSLDVLYRRAHIISLHTPLTNETRGLLDARAFRKMRRGVLIINCARGGLIVERDLLRAIERGRVAGVALDVFEQEPPPRRDPLVQREEVIGTPHLGASTREAQVTVSVEIARQVVDYLLYGLIRNAVNVPSLSPELYPVLEPYLRLAEKLGEFQAQLIPAALDEVQVEYSGEVSEFEVAPLTVSLLKGLLSTAMPGSVNYVNAPVIARDRGIRVVESKSRTAADFASLVTLRVRSREGESTVAGTIFGRKEPRLVRIGSFELEAIPEGHLLVIQSNDRPGVIGHIGAVLGRNGINIAQMQLGRKRVGGEALSLIQIDSQAGPEVIDQLLRLPHINAVRPVEL